MIQPQFPDGAQVEATRRGSSRSGRADEPHGDVQYAHDLFHVKTELLLFFLLLLPPRCDFGSGALVWLSCNPFPLQDKSLPAKKKREKKENDVLVR